MFFPETFRAGPINIFLKISQILYAYKKLRLGSNFARIKNDA